MLATQPLRFCFACARLLTLVATMRRVATPQVEIVLDKHQWGYIERGVDAWRASPECVSGREAKTVNINGLFHGVAATRATALGPEGHTARALKAHCLTICRRAQWQGPDTRDFTTPACNNGTFTKANCEAFLTVLKVHAQDMQVSAGVVTSRLAP
jgi:hypothetical protein